MLIKRNTHMSLTDLDWISSVNLTRINLYLHSKIYFIQFLSLETNVKEHGLFMRIFALLYISVLLLVVGLFVLIFFILCSKVSFIPVIFIIITPVFSVT